MNTTSEQWAFEKLRALSLFDGADLERMQRLYRLIEDYADAGETATVAILMGAVTAWVLDATGFQEHTGRSARASMALRAVEEMGLQGMAAMGSEGDR